MEILVIGAIAIVALFGIHSQTTTAQTGGGATTPSTNSAIQPPPVLTAEQVINKSAQVGSPGGLTTPTTKVPLARQKPVPVTLREGTIGGGKGGTVRFQRGGYAKF